MKTLAVILFCLILSACQSAPESVNDNATPDTSDANVQTFDDEWNKQEYKKWQSPVDQAEIQKDLRKRAKEAEIINLKDKKIGADEIEIRIWQLNTHFNPEIFVYNRKGNVHDVIFIKSDSQGDNRKIKLDSPKSGWESFDNYLQSELRIDENMNFSRKGEHPPVPDGGSLLIEMKTSSVYKVEEFSYPSNAFDGMKFNDLYKKLNDEFEINKKSGIQITNE